MRGVTAVEWIAQNLSSIIILTVTAAIIGLLLYSVIKGHKAAAALGRPACYGCPNAKKCHTGASVCSCNAKKDSE